MYIKNPTIAPQNAFTAIPPSKVESADTRESIRPIKQTNIADATPKINAKISSAKIDEKKVIANTAPNAEPDDTPVIDGSASELRNKLCIPAPASAKLAPVRIPAKSLGKRISHTSKFAV